MGNVKILFGKKPIEFLDQFGLKRNGYSKVVLVEETLHNVPIETVLNPFNCNITTYVGNVCVNKLEYWKAFPEMMKDKDKMVKHITELLKNPVKAASVAPVKSFDVALASSKEEMENFIKIHESLDLDLIGHFEEEDGRFTINYKGDEIQLYKTQYENGRLAILAFIQEYDQLEYYGDITLNINDPLNVLEENEAYIDVNNLSGLDEVLEKFGVATDTGKRATSGMCQYPLFKFLKTDKMPELKHF